MERLPEFIANHLFLVSLLIGISSLLLWNIFGTAASGIMEIGPAEMTRMMNHEKAVVLDVREEEDFEQGHVLNAVNIPAGKLVEQSESLSRYKERPLILTCRQGMDSIRAARIIRQKGFEKIYCLKGGLQAWRNANLPLISDRQNEKTS